LYDALAFVKQTLDDFKLSQHIKIIASGKIITGFDILKVLSLGASLCYSARGMMMALGCVQALICDSGKCPVGVATQDPSLYKALHPEYKKVRVANFHGKTIAATREMMEACAFKAVDNIHPSKFFRRINQQEVKSFHQIYFNEKESALKQNLRTQLN
jgi:glutamate synthase domain-containing protein 2